MQWLSHYNDILSKQFELVRAKFSHSGNKGANVEEIVRSFLSEALPNNFSVGHGEIVDSFGERTGEVDLVVFKNDLQPFVSDCRLPNIFIIEAVMAIGEVKSILDAEKLKAVVESCKKCKHLVIKPNKGDQKFTNEEDAQRFYDRRAYFLYSFDTKMDIQTLIDRLNELQINLDISQQIDAIFMHDKGVIVNFGSGRGAFQRRNGEAALSTGYVYIAREDMVTYWLVAWLMAIMPQGMTTMISPVINYLFKNHMESIFPVK